MKEFEGLSLVGGHPALDFMNTVEFRGAPQSGDRLITFERLARWSVVVGLLSPEEFARVSAPRSANSLRAGRALCTAAALRESLHAVVSSHVRNAPIPRAAGSMIEQHVRNARGASTLQYAGSGLGFAWHIPVSHPEDITYRLAESAGNLLLSLGSASVHQCGGPNCDWLFIDRSHGHRRLWCQPSKCGNVVRVRRSRSNRAK
jgi:predicted RNA-binding Zn ribbon-like protein